jgi:hypothetical protein
MAVYAQQALNVAGRPDRPLTHRSVEIVAHSINRPLNDNRTIVAELHDGLTG